jgi:hypothetical protein
MNAATILAPLGSDRLKPQIDSIGFDRQILCDAEQREKTWCAEIENRHDGVQELALTAPIQSQAQSKFAPAAALAADATVLKNYVSWQSSYAYIPQ